MTNLPDETGPDFVPAPSMSTGIDWEDEYNTVYPQYLEAMDLVDMYMAREKRAAEYVRSRFPDLEVCEHSDYLTALCDRLDAVETRARHCEVQRDRAEKRAERLREAMRGGIGMTND